VTSLAPMATPERRDGLPARKTHYLHPGRLWVSREPHTVTTILGSCVAIGLFDPSVGIGGLCHFLLPQWPGRGQASPRFGDVAVQQLIGMFAAEGIRHERLLAKVFGGACVIEAMRDGFRLGGQNVDLARRALSERKIPVVAEDVEGNCGRKLVFHTHDGSSWVKLLRRDPSWK
jgi:chemotaxis protein CheD